MNIDYVQAAEFLHRVLQDLDEILRQEKQNERALVTEQKRLQTVVAQVEHLGEDPGEAWQSLTIAQRWGYLRLVSYLGTAAHLLREGSHGKAGTEGPARAMRKSS